MSNSVFNEEQQDHMKWLSANPDHVCGCGWHSNYECGIVCQSHTQQRPEQRALRDERNRTLRIVITLIEKYEIANLYKLKEVEEYKHSNALRTHARSTLNIIKKQISENIRD